MKMEKESNLKLGSLFSGIGGFELGALHSGIETKWSCEINPFCQKVLKLRFPKSKLYEDITKLKTPEYVDIISGGFPCQDISVANTRGAKGINGKRSGLWKEYFRIIRELRPKYIVAENSAAITFRGLETVLCDLYEIGYNAQWQCLSATSFGFNDKRERIYIIAYANTHSKFSERMDNIFIDVQKYQNKKIGSEVRSKLSVDTEKMVFRYNEWGDTGQDIIAEPLLCGESYGLSDQVDRLAALGNSVKPQIAHYLFECIKIHNAERTPFHF